MNLVMKLSAGSVQFEPSLCEAENFETAVAVLLLLELDPGRSNVLRLAKLVAGTMEMKNALGWINGRNRVASGVLQQFCVGGRRGQ